MTEENTARRTQHTPRSQPFSRPWTESAGWALIGAVLAMVGYLAVAVTSELASSRT